MFVIVINILHFMPKGVTESLDNVSFWTQCLFSIFFPLVCYVYLPLFQQLSPRVAYIIEQSLKSHIYSPYHNKAFSFQKRRRSEATEIASVVDQCLVSNGVYFPPLSMGLGRFLKQTLQYNLPRITSLLRKASCYSNLFPENIDYIYSVCGCLFKSFAWAPLLLPNQIKSTVILSDRELLKEYMLMSLWMCVYRDVELLFIHFTWSHLFW